MIAQTVLVMPLGLYVCFKLFLSVERIPRLLGAKTGLEVSVPDKLPQKVRPTIVQNVVILRVIFIIVIIVNGIICHEDS